MTERDHLPDHIDTVDELDLDDIEAYAPDVLRDILEDVARAQYGDDIDVAFADENAADWDREQIKIDPTTPLMMGAESLEDQLRILTNTLNHEIEHFKSSDLRSKHDFVQEWLGWGKVPGLLINIIEDRYIDQRRVREYPGLRRTLAFSRKQYVDSMPPLNEIDSDIGAAVVGLSLYYAAGKTRPAAFDQCSDDVQHALNAMIDVTDGVEYAHDKDERWNMADDCMHILKDTFGKPATPPALPEQVADLLTSSTVGGEPEEAPAPDNGAEAQPQDNAYSRLPRPLQYLVIGLLTLLAPLIWLINKLLSLFDQPEKPEQQQKTPWGIPVNGGRSRKSNDGGAEPDEDNDDAENDVREDIKEDTDLSDDEDLDDPSKAMKRRAQSIRGQVRNYDPELAARKQNRDQRITEYRSERLSDAEQSERIRRDCRNSGLLSDIEQTFKSLLSQEGVRRSRTGQDIDMRSVTRRAAGDLTQNELFQKTLELDTGDRVVGVTTDISGSMEGDIRECKMAIASIARAVELCGDTFVATAFTDNPDYRGQTPDVFDLRLVTGPNESFEWEHLDQFKDEQNTPTAAAIYDNWNLMQRVAAEDNILLVITDGKASVDLDGDKNSGKAVKHVAEAVNDVEPECTVFGVGIGSASREYMQESFGRDSFIMTDIETLSDDLVTLLLDDVSLKRV